MSWANIKKNQSQFFSILLTGVILGTLFFVSSARADLSNGTVNVGYTVPAPQGGGGGGGGGPPPPPPPPVDNPPSITNVASAPAATTAQVTWTATDDKAIQTVTFEYGLTNQYGLSAAPSVNGSNYTVNLSNLNPNTQHFFRISVTDNANQTTQATGTFTTAVAPRNTPPVISNIQVATGISTTSISWDTDEQADSTVNYGLTNQYGSTMNDVTMVLHHSLLLNALTPNTTYHFKIVSTDQSANVGNTNDATFITQKDTVPPVISNVVATPGVNGFTITWDTDKNADSQINYGLTSNYGKTVQDAKFILNHSLAAASLLPNTTYHYRIVSTDQSGNSGNTTDASLTTLKDAVAPPDVSNLQLSVAQKSITLNWSNPSLQAVPDFVGVVVVRKIGGSSANVADGTTVYTGSAETFTDNTVGPSITYFYTVFSYDTSGNYSAGIFKSGTTFAAKEICNNNIDDDGNGLTDCADPACAADQACIGKPKEICDNKIDDDGNGLVDCADPACFGFPACINNPQPQPQPEAKPEQPPYIPPSSTVSSSIKLMLSDFTFLAGANNITLEPDGGVVRAAAGFPVYTSVKSRFLLSEPKSIVLKIDGADQHQMVRDNQSDVFFSTFVVPVVGNHVLTFEIDYGNNQLDSVAATLASLSAGQVKGADGSLSGAVVTLFDNTGAEFDAQKYNQNNPLTTNVNGIYTWMVPNGTYKIKVVSETYFDGNATVNITNNVVNNSFTLITRPPSLLDQVNPNATLTENVSQIAKNLTAQSKIVAQVAQIIAQNPDVQRTARQVVVPTAVSVAAVSTLPLISFADLVPLLRLLFLEPLMLLGLRRRTGWGQVYNSLSKQPIDLATVRLINASSGKLIQSKVTDRQGRYAFVVDPGTYKIEVIKNGLVFPSSLLKSFKDDGRKPDIYHGEVITVTSEDAIITANIPVDPTGQFKTPRRLILERFGRRLQTVLSWVGFLATAITLYISPRWYVWALLGLHIGLTALFRRLSKPPKNRSWGIIYDTATRKPVGRAVVRLFSSQFNKLVATQVSDGRGRYYFLAGDNQFFVTGEHANYQTVKSSIIDLSGKEADTISVKLGLVPGGQTPPAGKILAENVEQDLQSKILENKTTPGTSLPVSKSETSITPHAEQGSPVVVVQKTVPEDKKGTPSLPNNNQASIPKQTEEKK